MNTKFILCILSVSVFFTFCTENKKISDREMSDMMLEDALEKCQKRSKDETDRKVAQMKQEFKNCGLLLPQHKDFDNDKILQDVETSLMLILLSYPLNTDKESVDKKEDVFENNQIKATRTTNYCEDGSIHSINYMVIENDFKMNSTPVRIE